jgi:ferredoxin
MTVRVSIDGTRCGGHGECVFAAPEVFDFRDEDDVASVLCAEPAEPLWARVEGAARVCPTGAIRVES